MDGPFRAMLDDRLYSKRGFFEALSVQIPERFGVELYGLVDWQEEARTDIELKRILVDAFKESLLWRDPKKTNEDTLEHINSILGGLTGHLFEVLVRLAVVPDHPLNAGMLHRNLMRIELPNRDKLWTTWAVENWQPPYEGESTAIRALVDWALSVDESTIDDERTYLACLALGWFLTSPNRSLRDKATKAMVSLIGGRVRTIRRLLLEFDKV